VFSLAYLAWAILPILVAIRFSFNEGRSISSAQGWSLRWYTEDPDLSVLHDPRLSEALLHSLELAALATLIAVPLGAAMAVGLTRWRGRLSKPATVLGLATLLVPEIILASAAFLVFVQVYGAIGLGTTAQVIGHVTISVVFVMIIVRTRLVAIPIAFEEAARDLGASPTQALRMVLLPMLIPAIVASAAVVLVISMDDFLVSSFLAADVKDQTVPVLIYSSRTTPTPAVNALATLTLLATIVLAALAYVAYRFVNRNRNVRGGSVLDGA
jgi:spermidine/putrescine transport system permease protein